ncbi:hypothetical protein [Clostridium algidicarnis]|uniref:hypothetical protein n=1 Tax=Clostridium algidicarnis TaxID=37659 RepID=UPI003FD80668
MTRGRKVNKVKVMSLRDDSLLKQLSNTGLCTMEQAKSHCGLNRDRILNLEKSGLIRIERTNPRGGAMIEVVRLERKGKTYSMNILGTKYFYKTSINQVGHDLKLTEAYYQVMREHKGAIWKNESQVTHEYKELLKNGRDCVDAVVVLDGDTFAVEVIGHKYTQETINNKIENGNRIAGETVLI